MSWDGSPIGFQKIAINANTNLFLSGPHYVLAKRCTFVCRMSITVRKKENTKLALLLNNLAC